MHRIFSIVKQRVFKTAEVAKIDGAALRGEGSIHEVAKEIVEQDAIIEEDTTKRLVFRVS